MPRLDLCAARLCRQGGALLPEEGDQAAPPPRRLYIRRAALGTAQLCDVVITRSRRRRSNPAFLLGSGSLRWARNDDGGSSAHRTAVKKRLSRKPESQAQTGWFRMPRSQEPTTASARPTRLSIGSSPTPPSRTETRLSAELSRLSPSTNNWPGGTVTSGVLSSRPLSRSFRIMWEMPFGSVS